VRGIESPQAGLSAGDVEDRFRGLLQVQEVLSHPAKAGLDPAALALDVAERALQ
jgi:hypothetical protein